MREFLPNARRELKAAVDSAHLFFRHINTKVLWAIAMLALFLIPTTAYGWWNGNSLMPTLQPQRGVGQSGVPTPLKDATANTDITVSQSSVPDAMNEAQSNKTVKPLVRTQVHINGQPVPVPDSGTVHKEINNENGNTTVDISVDSSSSGSSGSNTSMNIDLNSVTQSSVDGNTP